MLRNRAQLAYNAVGRGWKERPRRRRKWRHRRIWQAQLKLQDEAAQALREARHRLGALTFDRIGSAAGLHAGQRHGYHRASQQSRRAPDRRFHDRRQ
jgi:hypothetical protein